MVAWFSDPLWILLWRHWRESYRRLGLLVWELSSGLLFFLVLVMLKYCLHQDLLSVVAEIKKTSDHSTVRVVTTPFSGPLRSLMTRVCALPELSEKYDFYCTFDKTRKYSKTELDVEQFRSEESLSEPTIVVTFLGTNDNNLSQALNYTIFYKGIRLKEGRFKELYTERTSEPVHHLELLADLQWSIDKTYMEKRTGQNITHGLSYRPSIDISGPELHVVHNLLIVCCVLAPLPHYLYITAKMITERKSGMSELIKMMGVTVSKQRWAYLLSSAVFGILYSCLVTIFLKMTREAIVAHTDPLIIIITLTLHFLTTICVAFVTSSLSQDSQHCDSLAILLYLFTFLLNILWYIAREKNMILTLFVGAFLPHAPLYMFWDEVTFLEQAGHGLTFYTAPQDIIEANKVDTSQHSTSVCVVWTYLLIQIVIIKTVAWYLDLVRPGQFGVAAHWNFLFSRKFWRVGKKKKRTVNFHVTSEKSPKVVLKDNRYFEKGPRRASIAIKIVKVRKVFEGKPPVSAIHGVSMDVYRGEITVLLGVNGAGKSTLLSLITGMYSATKGKIYVNGYDNSRRMVDVRRDMRFCPQSNITFEYLTVKENIVFYECLKGGEMSHAIISAETLMTKLNIHDKADYFSYQLPAGIKRALQVACTLAGDAEVLILDEPSADMDEKRMHSLWDLLLLLRGQRTILIASTNIEEAYALADRIALINHGNLMCYGTPGFLKNAMGTDFNLSIIFKKPTLEVDVGGIKEAIGDTVDSLQINPQRRLNSISVALPANNRNIFPQVFHALEARKSELGIEHINVGLSMEKVFYKFIDENEEVLTLTEFKPYVESRVRGCQLWRQRMQVLIWRAIKFLWFRKVQFLVLQIIVPLLGLVIITLATNTVTKSGYDKIYGTEPDKLSDTVVYNAHSTGLRTGPDQLDGVGPGLTFLRSNDVVKDINNLMHTGNHSRIPIIGFDINDNQSTIYLPTNDQETITKSINLFSNLFLKLRATDATNATIASYYNQEYKYRLRDKNAKNLYLCLGWSMWVSFLIVVVLAPFIILPIEERHNGVRISHTLAGCSPALIFLSKLITHFAIYIVFVLPTVLLVARFVDTDNTFVEVHFLGAVTAILVGFGLAFLVHLYVLSFCLHKERAVLQIYITSLCFCLLTPIFLFFFGDIAYSSEGSWLWKIPFIMVGGLSHFSPVFTLTMGLVRITIIARSNAICKANRKLCPDGIENDIVFQRQICCNSKEEVPYKFLSFYNLHSGIVAIFVFAVQFIAYYKILICLQNRSIQYDLNKMAHCNYVEPAAIYNDSKVQHEAEYVRAASKSDRDETIASKAHNNKDALLVKNLHKSYEAFKTCSVKTYPAVGGISFSVKKGESLVILGKNGVGKTSTLDSLVGYTPMTRGNAWANGYFIRKQRKQYLRHLAWMGSATGMDGFLSGYDNLSLLACLQGFNRLDATIKTIHVLRYMGLESFSNVLARSYSPGCARRLLLCSNLLLGPRVALLDEPFSKVDPSARPLVARAVKCLLNNGTACVIAAESMEWTLLEQIATRIAIMARGQFIAIGTLQEIRDVLGIGYSITIKLKIENAYQIDDEGEEDDKISLCSVSLPTPLDQIKRLKTDVMNSFEGSKLTSEHLSALYFYVKDDKRIMLYSEMFTQLELLKAKYPDLIDDYNLHETSVEQALHRLEKELIEV